MGVNQLVINFAGLTGKILKSSPHGNYLVVQLTNRIVICGTFSNQFQWPESFDEFSGFESFILYIGVRNAQEAERFLWAARAQGGYFYNDREKMRKSKRVPDFPFEIKVRGLSPESVLTLRTE